MNDAPGKHPEDLSPYLDGDLSDDRYEGIRLHLEHCAACSGEAADWLRWQEVLRRPEAEIEVPANQWREISARLESSLSRVTWWERLIDSMRPHRLAWGSAAAVALLVGAVISGLEYRDYAEGKQQLTALSVYSKAEQQWIARADNPFRDEGASMENPFRKPDPINGNVLSR